MKKNFISKLTVLTVSTTLCAGFFSPAITTLAKDIKTESKITSSSNEVVTENDRFIKIEDDKGITIIDKTLLNKTYNENESEPEITPRMARYKVKNKRYLGQYIDYNNTLRTVSGNGGVNLNLTFSKTLQSSVSTTFGVSKSDISSTVGFNVSSSYTVSYSGSYLVPSNVKRATLKAHPLYEKYEYGIYLRGRMGQPDVKMKTGYALKPIGIHYEKNIIN